MSVAVEQAALEAASEAVAPIVAEVADAAATAATEAAEREQRIIDEAGQAAQVHFDERISTWQATLEAHSQELSNLNQTMETQAMQIAEQTANVTSMREELATLTGATQALLATAAQQNTETHPPSNPEGNPGNAGGGPQVQETETAPSLPVRGKRAVAGWL